MLRYQIQKLPNGKIYGELYTESTEGSMSVDVVQCNQNMVLRTMGMNIPQLIIPQIKAFVKWRKLSIDKAGRNMWPETAKALNALNDLCGSLPHYNNFDLLVRKVAEARSHVETAKPKTKCELWNSLDKIVKWAETLQMDARNKFGYLMIAD